MAKTDAPQGRERPSWIPVTVAVLAVAVFMGWLATREPPESVAVQEPGDTASDTMQAAQTGPAQTIEPDVLLQSAATEALIGQNVELTAVRVSDILGTNMFWIELPGGAPYLVRLDDTNIAAGAPLPATGSSVRVVGRILEKDAALIETWAAADSLTDDQRMLADFGSTFIEARRVESAGS